MDNQSLSHSRYNCTYHIVFIPKFNPVAVLDSLVSISSSRQAYMTFAVLLIGSRSTAFGSGIHGGRGASVIRIYVNENCRCGNGRSYNGSFG